MERPGLRLRRHLPATNQLRSTFGNEFPRRYPYYDSFKGEAVISSVQNMPEWLRNTPGKVNQRRYAVCETGKVHY